MLAKMSFLWNDKVPTCIKSKSKNVADKSTEVDTSKCHKKDEKKTNSDPKELTPETPRETSKDGEKETDKKVTFIKPNRNFLAVENKYFMVTKAFNANK
jgi:hypothetical protein